MHLLNPEEYFIQEIYPKNGIHLMAADCGPASWIGCLPLMPHLQNLMKILSVLTAVDQPTLYATGSHCSPPTVMEIVAMLEDRGGPRRERRAG